MPDPRQSLCFALDVSTREEARRFVELLAPDVGIFKVGLELFVREGPDLVESVRAWGAGRIFLDLKLHDIPRTVRRAARSAAHLPVDLLSVHCESMVGLSGPAAAGEPGGGAPEPGPALLGVTVLTSLAGEDLRSLGYAEGLTVTDLVLLRAEIARRAGCAGVICSAREVRAIRERFGPGFLVLTPGVRPSWSVVRGDDQARVVTPYGAIRSGADIVVVGRPIASAQDPAEAARRILEEIARAYQDR